MNLILASASERRIELLKRITEDFVVIVSNFDEDKVKFTGKVHEYVMELSKQKACVTSKSEEISKDDRNIIIAFDTVVSIDNKILGKPKDREEAFRMLKMLSGKIHNVYTGVTIFDVNSGVKNSDYVCTKVKFSHLTDKAIDKYLDLGEYKDKAGAYGIQGYAAVFVESIEGCFYSVVGLPLNKLNNMFGEMGINL
ncbi:septum formation protein [Clostridium acidisoli DSM 12555]|jgi:septum formation protein|uniref:dTTP/UTP pyrophosphatase n=1 Tax=Clostridium acidisoli DSM 12555 TaxID=1121291 RepID=A0A1W1X601_9CLOT|nr:Maf-like protein [Clostridium acidisoli]SMC19148.1 septum formation protein [Clostridium acidisoli DSM 12555]